MNPRIRAVVFEFADNCCSVSGVTDMSFEAIQFHTQIQSWLVGQANCVSPREQLVSNQAIVNAILALRSKSKVLSIVSQSCTTVECLTQHAKQRRQRQKSLQIRSPCRSCQKPVAATLAQFTHREHTR
tara:strand:+ start:189833 stop:190216 length:384 start_codon:yes stop_codon:yes gene_type:complete